MYEHVVAEVGPCFGQPCGDHGTCTESVTSNEAIYTCICHDEYTGTNCDIGKCIHRNNCCRSSSSRVSSSSSSSSNSSSSSSSSSAKGGSGSGNDSGRGSS